MTSTAPDGPVFALVDDHMHAARLTKRALKSVSELAQLVWLGDAERGRRSLNRLLKGAGAAAPDAVIVDLKAHSSATADFIGEIWNPARKARVPIFAMSGVNSHDTRALLEQSGADAVCQRHQDYPAYRAEIEEL